MTENNNFSICIAFLLIGFALGGIVFGIYYESRPNYIIKYEPTPTQSDFHIGDIVQTTSAYNSYFPSDVIENATVVDQCYIRDYDYYVLIIEYVEGNETSKKSIADSWCEVKEEVN